MIGTSLRRLLGPALFCLVGCAANSTDSLPWTATDAQGRPVPGFSVQGAAGSAAVPGLPGAPGAVAAGSSAPTVAAGSCDTERLGARAVLLAPRQYVNVLRDVLGPKAVSDQDAAASSELVFDTVDRPQLTTATLDRIVRLAEQATQTLKGRTAMLLGCSATTDTACVRKGLSAVARRAFKRPVAADELDQLMALRDMGAQLEPGDQTETGILAALPAVLIAPSTLYRTEFSLPVQGQARSLSAHERGAALAALLLDSVPDDALLAAADDGSLATDAGAIKQIDRLLALPRVRTQLTSAILTAYNVPRVFNTPKDAKLYPDYTSQLQNSMYEETRRFVEDILWTRNAPLSELLTSRRSFVDAPLAKLYGVPTPRTAFEVTMLPPERSGLLTQASVMSVLSRPDKTSVVARGLYVRGNLLCLPKIPGPPTSVLMAVAMQLEADATQKDLAAYRAKTSPCMGCHAQFDRFGLLLEQFDAIGRHVPAQSSPIDFTGLASLDGVVADVNALAERTQKDQLFERCLSDRTLGYALTVAADSNTRCLGNLRDPAKLAKANMRDLIVAIATSPSFTTRSGEL
jgi:hypothetical protein